MGALPLRAFAGLTFPRIFALVTDACCLTRFDRLPLPPLFILAYIASAIVVAIAVCSYHAVAVAILIVVPVIGHGPGLRRNPPFPRSFRLLMHLKSTNVLSFSWSLRSFSELLAF